MPKPRLPEPPHRLITTYLGVHPDYSPNPILPHLFPPKHDFYPADRYHMKWIITGEPRRESERPCSITLGIVETLRKENEAAARLPRWGRLSTTETSSEQLSRGLPRIREWIENPDPSRPVKIEGRELRYGPGGKGRIDLAHPSLQVALFQWFVENRGMSPWLTDFEGFRYVFTTWLTQTVQSVDPDDLPTPVFPRELEAYLSVPIVPPEDWMSRFSQP